MLHIVRPEKHESDDTVLLNVVSGVYPLLIKLNVVTLLTVSEKLAFDVKVNGGFGDPVIIGVVRALDPTPDKSVVP